MPSIFQRKGFRICRVCFRWFRIVLLLLVLTLVCAFIYLNQVGLPERVKRALVAELRARGVEFQFEKMRLDFYGGIVAEKVVVERMGEPDSPRVLVDRVGLQLNPGALMDFRFAVDSLSVRGGRLVVPLGATNVPGEFTVEGIEAEVAFLPGDRWQVEGLRARCLGARFQLAGWVDHASAFSEWKIGKPATTATNLPPRDWRVPFRDVVEAASRMKFAVPPLVKGRLRADGREPMRAHARLEIESGGAETPWGNAERLRMTFTSHPATNRGAIIGGEVTLRLEGARTPWGSAAELELESQAWPFDRAGRWRGADFRLHAIAPDSKWGRAKDVTVVSKANAQQQIGNLPSASLDVRATGPDTPWGRARSLHLTLATGEMATNLAGMSATLELSAENPETPWGKAASTWLQARVWKRPTPTIPATNATLGEWNNILPYELKWKLRGESVVRPELTVDQLSAEGHWRAPDLRIDQLEASVLGGKLASSAQLDINTRALQAGVSLDFDVKKLDRILGTNTQQWLAQLGWNQPPVVTAQAGLTLPPWTNAQPDWKSVVPSLWLRGALTNEAGNFRGIGFDRARLDFAFTNYVWHLRDLVVNRRGARLDIEHTSDERTRDHWWRIVGDAHLLDLKPLFGDGADRMLGFFKFTGPTHVDGELWGRWRDLDRYGARATVRATNWSFRGEQMTELSATATYTNRNIQFRDVRLVRPEGQLTLAAGSFDLPTMRVHLTNGLSTVEPGSVLRPIGPETARTMAPYQFGLPPTVTINGFICVTNISQVDLRFGIAGGPFHWTRFNKIFLT